ncbi:DUF4199 domain-containing protein [Geothrix sp. 21YS21S-4]|uniref:DUF4199 domain-containing protein n=1 Tax=Geothrix sp. 21YS21S-4 TaxID=3068889 RepID=UPI0027BA0941|nr:DUF4199 domain-containing protein [Geothrix sp. 21YS21S-4]
MTPRPQTDPEAPLLIPFRAGVLLGALAVLWTFVMGFTGWYRQPTLLFLLWLVIPLQIVILAGMLRLTAPTAGYFRQVQNGVAASVIASLIIAVGSLLFTTVVFPSYFREMEALGRLRMAHQGLSADQIEALVKAQAPMRTPLGNAFAGALGTWLTGLGTSLVAAAWFRRR